MVFPHKGLVDIDYTALLVHPRLPGGNSHRQGAQVALGQERDRVSRARMARVREPARGAASEPSPRRAGQAGQRTLHPGSSRAQLLLKKIYRMFQGVRLY